MSRGIKIVEFKEIRNYKISSIELKEIASIKIPEIPRQMECRKRHSCQIHATFIKVFIVPMHEIRLRYEIGKSSRELSRKRIVKRFNGGTGSCTFQ